MICLNIGGEYLKTVIQRFRGTKITAEKAIEQLNESELFWSPNEESNSVAIIVKHMSGNMISRWTDFFTTDGEKLFRNPDEMNLLEIYKPKKKLWNCGS